MTETIVTIITRDHGEMVELTSIVRNQSCAVQKVLLQYTLVLKEKVLQVAGAHRR